MSDMPKEIWAQRVHHTIDAGESNNLGRDTKYIRHDPDTITISREELKVMRAGSDIQMGRAYNNGRKDGWNALIDKLLEE